MFYSIVGDRGVYRDFCLLVSYAASCHTVLADFCVLRWPASTAQESRQSADSSPATRHAAEPARNRPPHAAQTVFCRKHRFLSITTTRNRAEATMATNEADALVAAWCAALPYPAEDLVGTATDAWAVPHAALGFGPDGGFLGGADEHVFATRAPLLSSRACAAIVREAAAAIEGGARSTFSLLDSNRDAPVHELPRTQRVLNAALPRIGRLVGGCWTLLDILLVRFSIWLGGGAGWRLSRAFRD